jgi:ABC-type sugar transport system permease subunit
VKFVDIVRLIEDWILAQTRRRTMQFSSTFIHTPFSLPIPTILCQTFRMRNLTATLCLTLAVILGFVLGIAWMSTGNDASNGEYLRALKTMGGSGVNWIDAIFRYCVVLLVNVAKALGISYEALNIWVFIIIQPLFIVVLLGWVLKLRRKVKKVR